MKIELDLDFCLGYANCVVEAPELFDLDDAAEKAIILIEEPDESMRDKAEQAVRVCPASALRLKG